MIVSIFFYSRSSISQCIPETPSNPTTISGSGMGGRTVTYTNISLNGGTNFAEVKLELILPCHLIIILPQRLLHAQDVLPFYTLDLLEHLIITTMRHRVKTQNPWVVYVLIRLEVQTPLL